MATVHGPQGFLNQESNREDIKNKEGISRDNKGHSIGYNQPSVRNGKSLNKLKFIEPQCQNMKEQAVKSRPTSSSSSFMNVNPLLGANSKYIHNLRFQPLDGDIIEEEKGILKRTFKNKKRRIKKKKKKVIRCKNSDNGSKKRDESNNDQKGIHQELTSRFQN